MMLACWQPQSSWRCAAACCSRRTTCAHQHQQQQVPSTPMLQPCTNTQSCAHEANPGHRNDLTLTSPRQPGTAQKHHAHRVATPRHEQIPWVVLSACRIVTIHSCTASWSNRNHYVEQCKRPELGRGHAPTAACSKLFLIDLTQQAQPSSAIHAQ